MSLSISGTPTVNRRKVIWCVCGGYQNLTGRKAGGGKRQRSIWHSWHELNWVCKGLWAQDQGENPFWTQSFSHANKVRGLF